MLPESSIEDIRETGRVITPAVEADKTKLGPLKDLPGRWSNDALPGRGWNIIALPFFEGPFGYRLLMNQYNEDLTFEIADTGVPNRGVETAATGISGDQFVVALDYQQVTTQIAAADFPESGLKARNDTPIHHEPGLFLHMTNKARSDEALGTFDVARLGTIPHGDSVLALGTVHKSLGIPPMSGLPVGTRLGHTILDEVLKPADATNRNDYVAPYRHFYHAPFKGTLAGLPDFPGFEPVDTTRLLREALAGETVLETTVLDFDTTIESGGILNIPFVVDEANATSMRSIFWIHKVKGTSPDKPRMLLQYAQFVFLDFFPRGDGSPGLIRWPHISINTMEKVEDDPKPMYAMVRDGKFDSSVA
ncbi:heme-binding protein [Rhodovulum visakhapatnamense]|uniref:Uncharacterized protein n=1 Tax=Rhodovulum visakhapatnamense TaxID=364297 RepID=A0A4R8G905_9RHOB|nr:heme-binding protein [Rhodovulum visakhapatnamense]TDX33639.1 hypothetical protein EV657_10167 [Rhodovulum visakhapatnamense]